MSDVPFQLRCVRCAASFPGLQLRYVCDCGGTLDVIHGPSDVALELFDQRLRSRRAVDRSGVWR
ncbi:MAG TPA: hypothetical protein ENK18_12550, partial [Deltaproteobacteria bacterium]|nr:hypothetical protein [Deltaproteobacteria bacterium]